MNRFYKTLLTIGVLGVLAIGVLGIYSFKKGSADGRVFIWKVSTQILKDNPVFGVGFDRFKAHYMDAQADYFAKHGETSEAMLAGDSNYMFNDWFQFVVEQGVLGFLLLMVLVYVIFKLKANPKNQSIIVIIKVSFVAIGIFAFFSYPVQILPIKLIVLVLLALLSALSVKKYKPIDFKSIPLKKTFKFIVLVIGILLSTLSFTQLNKLERGFYTWDEALDIYNYGVYDDAIEEYKEAYPIFKNDGEFLMNYGKTLSIYKQHKEAVKVLKEAQKYTNTTVIETALGDSYKALKKYKLAERAYQNAANMIPIRFYPNYLLAKLYEETGQKVKAIKIANEVLVKEIKIPSTAIKEIKAEMKQIIAKYKL